MSSLKFADEVLSLLNAQANHELMTSNTYLAMANWFQLNSYPGSAHWMKIQSEEERSHSIKLFDYVSKRQGATSIIATEGLLLTFCNKLIYKALTPLRGNLPTRSGKRLYFLRNVLARYF
jgi:hypothetical protein